MSLNQKEMYKNYMVTRTKTGEELESFSTQEAAEKFMIMMQSKGESVQIKTDSSNIDEENPGFEIGDLKVEEPDIEFGTDLDGFNEDSIDFDISEDA